jgi:tetratricopeptide (TPR) repeat protein
LLYLLPNCSGKGFLIYNNPQILSFLSQIPVKILNIGSTLKFCLLLVALAAGWQLHAQPKLDFEIRKPKEFEERQLGSEKSADKKFTVVRRFFQNTYTHYNYYFNANNLINEIMASSAQANVDDYTELLPYYPWKLEQTSQSRDIDSILKTVTAGILLHDLRNDWIDNMYLLMGKAYYLRKNFDSAAMAFQFLNYSWANKDKDGNNIPIGSNLTEGSNSFAIMTEERKNYLLKRPPSRNDGFVWQIRNLTDRGNFLDASSLVAIIRNDPNFPKRLEPQMNDVLGYLFYKLEMWDSAAHYLEQSMSLANGPSDRARRWFLTGQLYQLGNNPAMASEAYSKCLGLATDLVMDVYARLNSIRLRKSANPEIIEQNVRDLLAMARRDKYYDYRDIIYYAAALVELERDGFDAADEYLQKSISNNKNNSKQKSLSFLALGDLRFDQKKYGPSGPPYDSIDVNHLKPLEKEKVEERKPPTLAIFQAEKIISLQDSLIALADLPDDERNKIVREISRQLRKSMGLKEEVMDMGVESPSKAGISETTNDLFASGTGSWYFYDGTLRSNGFNNFKARWGARPNDDNWRRSSALMMATTGFPVAVEESADPDGFGTKPLNPNEAPYDSTDISFDNLYSRIPTTPERRLKAEESIIEALFSKAKALHEQIEDYPEAVKVYEEILRRRDTGALAEKCLFALIHCYTKMGETAKAQQTRQKLQKANPDMIQAKENRPDRRLLDETYERIYDLFLEGQFAKALAEKQKADSLLGNSYWKPQLLYIQSVYHIKQREDSAAIKELNNIITTFPDHKLSAKSKRIIDVLKRRSEIEAYLTNLNITRAEEDAYTPTAPVPVAPQLPKVEKRSAEDSARVTDATLLTQKQIEEAKKAEAERLAKEKAEKLAREEAEAKALADAKKQEEALAAKAEADRLAKEEADRLAKLESDRLAKEEEERKAKAEADRLAREDAERKAKAEAERIEKEEAERLERERLAREEEARIAAEKAEAERLAAEKALAEKQAAEKLKAEQELAAKLAAEKEKAEKELAEKLAAEKAKAEKELAEKQAREKEAIEKEAANKAEAERLLAEKQAAEKAALEKEMADKLAAEKEKAEKERMEKEAAEKAASEKALADKQAAEKAEAERMAKEKANKEAAERAETERQAQEKAEAEKVAREQARKEEADKAESERLAKEKEEKAAADKAEAERLAAKEKAAKEAAAKAEADRIAKEKSEKEAAEKAEAERLAKEKAEKDAAEKAALAKANMIDNVTVGKPTTPSPYKINANEKQVVAIVLERIDPAYVNEVAYSLTHSSFKNIDNNEVEVIKKKIRDNLWLVELRSDGFKNMQAAYEYIKYIKPITKDELVTWLDESKYYFLTISEESLKEIEKSGDVKLYYKVLQEAVPGKF